MHIWGGCETCQGNVCKGLPAAYLIASGIRYTPATVEEYKQRFGNKAEVSELGHEP